MKFDLEKLYFGIKVLDFNTGKLKTENLFNSVKILRSIAHYTLNIKGNKKYIKENNIDPLLFCYGATWARCEYEFVVGSLFAKDEGKEEKVDVYEMYVKPNQEYLMFLANNVSTASAKRVMKKYQRVKRLTD